jgi:hypothetical protein
MPAIQSGLVAAFYLFDVAEAIDLAAVPALMPARTSAARLAPKPATPAYLQYQSPPPLLIDGESLHAGDLDGFRVRVKLFEYGVVSLALTRPFAGTWADLGDVGQRLLGAGSLDKQAEQLCGRVVERLRPALDHPRATVLTEDYFVFAAHAAG